MKRNCDVCKKEYNADERNLKRGWGLCCSKSCAAQKRERSKPNYDPERVERNNIRRESWCAGRKTRITSEGYVVRDGVAYDEFDEPVYSLGNVWGGYEDDDFGYKD